MSESAIAKNSFKRRGSVILLALGLLILLGVVQSALATTWSSGHTQSSVYHGGFKDDAPNPDYYHVWTEHGHGTMGVFSLNENHVHCGTAGSNSVAHIHCTEYDWPAHWSEHDVGSWDPYIFRCDTPNTDGHNICWHRNYY